MQSRQTKHEESVPSARVLDLEEIDPFKAVKNSTHRRALSGFVKLIMNRLACRRQLVPELPFGNPIDQ